METKHHTKLTAGERDRIAFLLASGCSIRGVARKLGRSPSTVSEEVKNNSFKGKYYIAIHAQSLVDKRKIEAKRRHPLKSVKIYSHVIRKLTQGWSPEIIAGRLNKKHGKTVICSETIYSFVYSGHPEAKRIALWQYLPRGQKKRRKQKGRRVHKSQIPGRISIHQRPAWVEARKQIGHWEADTIEGRAHKGGVYTNQERMTRKVFLTKIDSLDSDQAIKVQVKLFGRLPEGLRKTATYDNGHENYKHEDLHKLRMQTFFTDPYSAWQKGSVENVIGIVRRYLPKGTDLTYITQEELTQIQEDINNRPRKVLNYNTPNEVFNSYLKCSDSN